MPFQGSYTTYRVSKKLNTQVHSHKIKTKQLFAQFVLTLCTGMFGVSVYEISANLKLLFQRYNRINEACQISLGPIRSLNKHTINTLFKIVFHNIFCALGVSFFRYLFQLKLFSFFLSGIICAYINAKSSQQVLLIIKTYQFRETE